MKLSTILAIALFAFAACGGGSTNAPSTIDNASDAPGEVSEGVDSEPAVDEEGSCCCELPSDPPTFELTPEQACHEDSHGVCSATLEPCADATPD